MSTIRSRIISLGVNYRVAKSAADFAATNVELEELLRYHEEYPFRDCEGLPLRVDDTVTLGDGTRCEIVSLRQLGKAKPEAVISAELGWAECHELRRCNKGDEPAPTLKDAGGTPLELGDPVLISGRAAGSWGWITWVGTTAVSVGATRAETDPNTLMRIDPDLPHINALIRDATPHRAAKLAAWRDTHSKRDPLADIEAEIGLASGWFRENFPTLAGMADSVEKADSDAPLRDHHQVLADEQRAEADPLANIEELADVLRADRRATAVEALEQFEEIGGDRANMRYVSIGQFPSEVIPRGQAVQRQLRILAHHIDALEETSS